MARGLVPDLAGWRRERMPETPQGAGIELPPDWGCEILSPGTARLDRYKKMPLYAAHGVPWLWLIDPLARTLEVHRASPRAISSSACSRRGPRPGAAVRSDPARPRTALG